MLNAEHIIESGGLLLITLIIFAESGLLIGFFLPGDTLLFSAGFFASQDKLPIIPLILLVIAAAIIGDNIGYSIGRRAGHRIFKRQDGIFFRQEHLTRAENFYEKHGGKTIILARFTPVVRTFAPVVAGAAKMPRQRFMFFNVFGAVAWGAGITMLGYTFGSRIPNIDRYIMPILGLVVILSFGPALYHLFKDKDVRQRLWNKIRFGIRSILLNKKID